MSASWFTAKVNLSTIVSQGLEHVSKLKDDVEKQFDEAVSGKSVAKPPPPLPSLFNETPNPVVEPSPSPPLAIISEQNETTNEKQDEKDSPDDDASEHESSSTPPSEPSIDPSTPDTAMTPQDSPLNIEAQVVADSVDDTTVNPDDSTLQEQPLDDMNPSTDENIALLDVIKSIPPAEESKTATLPSDALESLPAETSLEESSSECTATEESQVVGPETPSSTPDLRENHPDVAALERELTGVQADLRKTQAMLRERENQLLASSNAMAKLHTEIEALRPNESTVYQLQVALADKEMQLKSLLEEGEALSKKQAAFESRLRAVRKEKTDVMEENKKLTAALETANAKWETARMHLVAAEDDAKVHVEVVKTLDATQARLATTEAALNAAKQALAAIEGQAKQLREENQRLEAQTHLAASEDRDVLEATIRDLQSKLSQIQMESAQQEETSRAELQAMKLRWQEAVTRMDQLTRSTGDATQPLLRQIHQLQQDQRAQELRRLALEEKMERRVQNALHDLETLQAKHDAVISQADEWRAQVTVLETEIENLRTAKSNEAAEIASLRKALDTETHRRQQLEQQVQVISQEKRHVAQLIQSSNEQHEAQVKQMKIENDHLVQQVNQLRWQLQESQKSAQVPAREIVALERKQSSSEVLVADSMVEWHQLQQKVRLRESEAALLKEQIQGLEDAKRNATEEVVRLTTRNATLESAASELETTKAALAAMEVKQQVLLELLGERDEQVEELESEFREFKQMYQTQIDALTRR
ncbi:hypothetical protein LEN26_014323 [Aphanomyces euteiches]|nr:hypothetical protein LEN26_014323 [Aphanomyces euteiches]